MQQQYVIKAQRFEIMPYFAVTLNDQFVSHDAPGLALNYYITQVLAVGVNGNLYGALNADSDFNFQNRRAARIAVPLNDYQLSGDLNFTYVPMYGKFAGFGDFIFHYDAYIDGGVGVIRTRADPGHRPRQPDVHLEQPRQLRRGHRPSHLLQPLARCRSRGARHHVLREDREHQRGDRVDDPARAAGIQQQPAEPGTWYDPNTHFTNDVQLQVGLSLFLPTSFDYRLPK